MLHLLRSSSRRSPLPPPRAHLRRSARAPAASPHRHGKDIWRACATLARERLLSVQSIAPARTALQLARDFHCEGCCARSWLAVRYRKGWLGAHDYSITTCRSSIQSLFLGSAVGFLSRRGDWFCSAAKFPAKILVDLDLIRDS